MMATGMCGGALAAYADTTENEPVTPDNPVVTNLFGAPGCDALLQGEETEYDFKTGARVIGHINGSVKAKKEADGNVYLELGKDGSNAFLWSSLKITEAGDYKVSFDVKHAEGWTESSAFMGFRFWSNSVAAEDIDWGNVTAKMNGATTDKWSHIETTYNVSAAMVTGVDSIQMGYDADKDGKNFIMVDNIVIEYIVPDVGAPAVVGDAAKNWKEEDGGDVTFGVDLKGKDLLSVVNKKTEEEYTDGTEYTYSADNKVITFAADFIYELGEGAHSITLTTDGGTLDLVITVYYRALEIPSTTDGYKLEDTMLAGDFESYAVGLKFSDAQTEEAWGSLANYDDVGTIVDDNGNRALRLGRAEGSVKMFSSAFCMLDPKIDQGDIITLKFSYKIVGEQANVGANSNVSFVGAANVDYHLIKFVQKNETTIEGNKNVQGWAVKYADGQNGYTDVEMSFIVDFAFMNSTNSLRFLYQIGQDAEIYIDNVRLIRWVDEAAVDAEKPIATGDNLVFDGKNQNDVTLTVDLKDYNITSIKLGKATLAATAYTLGSDDTVLTINKAYLATLANGKHTFTLTTLGGACEFEITVANANLTTVSKKDDNTGLIVGLSVGGAAAIAAGAAAAVIIVRKKKKNKAR